MSATQLTWVGLDMDLYYNTGNYASPTWTIITNVQDLKRGCSLAEAELNSRGMPIVQKEPSLTEYVFNWGMIKNETDAAYLALRTAKDARTAVEFAFANGLINATGVTYFRVLTKIFGWDDEEPLTGGVVTSVTAKPCVSAHAPSWNLVP